MPRLFSEPGEVGIEEGRVGGRELAERVDSSWSGIGAMAPDIPPQIGRRLWLQATGQKFEVVVDEGRRDRRGLLLSGVDLCRRWPGMEMLYKPLMGETVDGVTAFAILHDVATGVAQ